MGLYPVTNPTTSMLTLLTNRPEMFLINLILKIWTNRRKKEWANFSQDNEWCAVATNEKAIHRMWQFLILGYEWIYREKVSESPLVQ